VKLARDALLELARPRLTFLALQTEQWWLKRVAFFDVERERNLDFLAASSAYGASSHPADGLFEIVGENGASDLRTYRRCAWAGQTRLTTSMLPAASISFESTYSEDRSWTTGGD
jgi:hypothetical protein